MPTLEHAIALAVEAHKGQTDRADMPYILHPMRVMFAQTDETAMIVGILHDVIEDSDYTFEDLREMGYSEEIIAALDGVTRREDETYEEFVERSAANEISTRIKLADLQDNMDVRRIKHELSDHDLARMRRYQKAWWRLTGGTHVADGVL